MVDFGETDPANADTDGDGLPDGRVWVGGGILLDNKPLRLIGRKPYSVASTVWIAKGTRQAFSGSSNKKPRLRPASRWRSTNAGAVQ